MEEEDNCIGKAKLDPAVADGFNQAELYKLLRKFEDVLSDAPGMNSLVQMIIEVGEVAPINETLYH